MAGVYAADTRNAERLGYLGLGMMGFPMARRLIDALEIYKLSATRTD